MLVRAQGEINRCRSCADVPKAGLAGLALPVVVGVANP